VGTDSEKGVVSEWPATGTGDAVTTLRPLAWA